MIEPLIDGDPGDECDRQHLETGLCASEWCSDAALPDEDYCPSCLADLNDMLEEFFVEGMA